MNRRITITLAIAISAAASAFAQTPATEALAAIGGRTITAQDLEPSIAEAWLALPSRLLAARKQLLEQQIDRKILELEAAKRSTTVEALVEAEVSTDLPDPTEDEIKRVYEENKDQIGDVPLVRVRADIVDFIKKETERERYAKFIDKLRSGHKITYGKNINDPGLLRKDVIATIDDITVIYLDYERRNGLALYEMEANITDAVIQSVTQVVDAAVYTSEAESLGIATSEFIAQEITGKMKDFSDGEREKLESDLRSRLYKKYRVIFLVNEVTPYVQAVLPDDDPFLGRANAKVTVVMFSDFECPACAGVHPIIKQVIKEFGANVRLVVRDFPLESIHKHAFQAAVAAEAAKKQGKFFEYIELLYNNQDALDRESLSRYADEAGLDLGRFERDINDPELASEIRKDISDGKSYGVTGTPGIFVNGYKIRTLSASSFKKAIKRALER
ncbi:MAG: hypothetical protein DWQ47_09375 [Acidobacteria bacterium]|nr:MAG: hypothetical protein DWQ32_17475 [Acidobacteriota bacterium]REJ98889.1 MAG: hypothetical protein DWQ38_12500 [Acidobacteriota bacterium]REK16391.1 MAG: hypothetical protein DWQ43_05185 [Acidobacteriota bacterium]REK44072.1 MAG: hypothetical protein DWQ47_09375 [Acidobacteriota bacterium]